MDVILSKSKTTLMLLITFVFSFSITSTAQAEEIYLIKGFMSVWSGGIDDLHEKLVSLDIDSSVHPNGQWSGLADDIIERAKSGQVSYPIIIAGHSLGGVEAAKFANKLGENGIPVGLIVGIDPGFPSPPDLVKGTRKVVNYKLPSGKDYVAGEGFAGTIKTVDVSEYEVSHTSIDDNPEIHDLIIQSIKSVL